MIEMELSGLGFDPRNMSPIVLLKDREERNFLPIWIGMFEAAAIAMELQGFESPRPMTHDLLVSIIKSLGGIVEKVIISEIKDDTFYSVLEIKGKNEKENLKIDCRPSDAIAVAVRNNAPIYVSESVMIKAKMVNQDKDKEETEKFQEFLNNIKPEDFEKYFKKH